MSGSAGGEGVAGHFCGQVQPHATHAWQTPPTFGGTTLISTYQCAGITPARAGAADTLRQAALRAAANMDAVARELVRRDLTILAGMLQVPAAELRRVLDDTKDQP